MAKKRKSANAAAYNTFRGKAAEAAFNRVLFDWKTPKEIQELYDAGITPTQIGKLFDHEVGLSVFKKEYAYFEKTNGEKKKVYPFPRGASLQVFSARIKTACPYTKEQHEKHLSQPQWKRLKYEHLGKSDEELQEMAAKQLKQWAADTCEKRKASGDYNKIYTLEYWIEKTGCPLLAEKKLEEYKRSISPWTTNFWTARGFDINEAQKKVSEYARRGARGTLKSTYGKCKSKLEMRIFEILAKETKDLVSQFFMGPYAYDICHPDSKKIIEINGTYWHADPRLYEEDDILFGGRTASEIWDSDKVKQAYAEEKGYEVYLLWEKDYCSDPNTSITNALDFLNGSKNK